MTEFIDPAEYRTPLFKERVNLEPSEADLALRDALAAAEQDSRTVDMQDVDRQRIETVGTVGAGTISSLSALDRRRALAPEAYSPTNPRDILLVGQHIQAYRRDKLAA